MLTHIVYSNWIVSAGSAVLSAGWAKFIQSPDWWLYGLFAFFSTLCVYNLQRLFKMTRYKRTPWLLWVDQNRKALMGLIGLSAFGAFLSFIFLSQFSWTALVTMAFAGFIAFFYVVNIFHGRNLRDVPHMKIHLIAITWSIVLILFPMINEGITDNITLYLLAHYAYVLAITIPFDIRDLKYDEATKRTIPQILGVQGAKFLALVLLGLCLSLLIYAHPEFGANPLIYLATGIQMILVLGMNPNRSDLYCAGAIDGVIMVLGLAYFIQ